MKRIEFWKMSDLSCLNEKVKIVEYGLEFFSILIKDIGEIQHLVRFLDHWLSAPSISKMQDSQAFWHLYPRTQISARIIDTLEKKTIYVRLETSPKNEIRLNFALPDRIIVSLSLSEAEELLKFLSERVKVKKRDL